MIHGVMAVPPRNLSGKLIVVPWSGSPVGVTGDRLVIEGFFHVTFYVNLMFLQF